MKPSIASLILLLSSLGLTAADMPAANHPGAVPGEAEKPTPQSILAAQVSEIAATPKMSRKEQARLIAAAVRLAVINATADIRDPDQKLRLALEFAAVAAKAAPGFPEAISTAIAGIPAIADIKGALEQVKSAVLAVVQSDDAAGGATPPPARSPGNPEFGGNKGDTVVSGAH